MLPRIRSSIGKNGLVLTAVRQALLVDLLQQALVKGEGGFYVILIVAVGSKANSEK
jgi:hypothetical protein